jgi:hypothetical protein
MKKNKNILVILTVAIVALVAVSIYISSNSQSTRSEHQSAGQKVLPNLYDRLNDVTSIEITTGAGTLIIFRSDKIVKDSNNWIIKSKGNYPGNIIQIRKTLIELAELKKVEAKTKKEKNYSKLGVQSVKTSDVSTANQSYKIVITADAEQLASIIIGNKKLGHTSRAIGSKSLHYARISDDAQVWLVAGNIQIPALNKYMNTELSNIAATRVQTIKITHPDSKTITISKKSKTDTEFTLKQLKKNKELSSPGILTSIASGLSNLNFEDVSSKSNDPKFEKPTKVEFTLFNGLAINLNMVKADNKAYLWLDAVNTNSVTVSLKQEDVESKEKTPDAKQEATDINKNHSRWLYTIQLSKAESLMKQLSELTKPKEKKIKSKLTSI